MSEKDEGGKEKKRGKIKKEEQIDKVIVCVLLIILIFSDINKYYFNMKSNILLFTLLLITVFSVDFTTNAETQPSDQCGPDCLICTQNKCTQYRTLSLSNLEATNCPSGTTNIQDVCVDCNIANCNRCSSYKYCAECSGSLVVSSDGSACVTCNVDFCQSCSSSGVCAVCNPGYEFSSSGTSCLNCSNVNGCSRCSSNNTCASCLTGYELVDNQCVLCEQPCLTCSATNKCITCVNKYSLNADVNGECFLCDVPNCQRCNENDVSQCITCNDQYIKTSDNKCSFHCSTYQCTNCQSDGTCLSCYSGYAPSGNTCVKCTGAPQCITCSASTPGTCTSCISGYYVSSGNCVQCPTENCATCDSTQCLTFKSGTGQFLYTNQTGDIMAAVCDQGCVQCSTRNPQACIMCDLGFTLKNWYCVPCDYPCMTCLSTDTSTCRSCYGNDFLRNGQCVSCNASSNCLTCSHANVSQCLSCPYGYYVSNGVCTSNLCDNNCLLCQQANNGTSQCVHCRSGFSHNSAGVCLPCLPNCRVCSGSQMAICLQCGPGFFLNSTYQCSSCASYSEHCFSCTDLACTGCVSGYFLNSTLQCTSQCSFPCASCDPTNSSVCYSCLGGYYLNGAYGCVTVTNENGTCASGICDLCPAGQTLNGIQCTLCTGNCSRCMTSSTSTCTSCLTGHYLQNSTCLACPTGCKTCSSETRCLSCIPGFVVEFSSLQFETYTCSQCLYPCATCALNTYTCTACVDGFYFNGWKCMSEFNYGITVYVQTNLTNFYNNYNAFLQSLVSPIQTTNINAVTVYSILDNPTAASFDNVQVLANLSATVPSGSSGARTQYDSVISSISQASSLGGMSVLGINIEVNGGEVPQPFNLGLLLGLVIPLGALLIAAVIYCLCANMDDNSGVGGGDQYKSVRAQSIRQSYELRENL